MILILGIGLTVLFIVVSITVYRYVCASTQDRKKRVTTIIFLLLLGFGDNLIGNIVYYYLVLTKGGEQIHQTVDNVPGFMLVTDREQIYMFMNDLFNNKYKYIEEYVTETNNDKLFTSSFSQQKGLYRFSFEKRGSDGCGDFENFITTSAGDKNRYGNKCMASVAIASPTSKHVVSFDKKKEISSVVWPVMSNLLNVPSWLNVSIESTVIKEIESGKGIAEFNNVYYSGGWFRRGMGHMGVRVYPEGRFGGLVHKDFVYKVLKPIKH